MSYVITYYNEALQAEILKLPDGLLSRYLALTDRMETYGAKLACPILKRLAVVCLNCGLKAQKALPVCFIVLWWGNVL